MQSAKHIIDNNLGNYFLIILCTNYFSKYFLSNFSMMYLLDIEYTVKIIVPFLVS